jgi:hypothetical protein
MSMMGGGGGGGGGGMNPAGHGADGWHVGMKLWNCCGS